MTLPLTASLLSVLWQLYVEESHMHFKSCGESQAFLLKCKKQEAFAYEIILFVHRKVDQNVTCFQSKSCSPPPHWVKSTESLHFSWSLSSDFIIWFHTATQWRGTLWLPLPHYDKESLVFVYLVLPLCFVEKLYWNELDVSLGYKQ